MDCRKVQEKIYDVIENRLPDVEHRELTAHFDNCPQCKKEYLTALKLEELYKTQPQKPLPDGFHARLKAKISNIETSRDPWLSRIYKSLFAGGAKWKIAFTAACVLLILLGVLTLLQPAWLTLGDKSPLVITGTRPQLTLAYSDAPVELFNTQKKSWEKTDRPAILNPGDRLKTGGANVVVMVNSSNSIRLAPQTVIKVETISRGRKKLAGRLLLEKGRIWIQEKEAASLQVETDRYLVKPVGTSYEVKKDKNGFTFISCYDGNVNVLLKKSGDAFEMACGETFLSKPLEVAGTAGAGKNKYIGTIEKLNGDKLEKDEWISWNRRVETPQIPGGGYPLSKPALRNVPSPMPQWYVAQRGDFQGDALSVPDNPGEWRKFQERKANWRKRIASNIKEHGGNSRVASSESGKIAYSGGTDPIPSILGDDENWVHKFSQMPSEKRKVYIRKMKDVNLLSSTFPDEAEELPPVVIETLKQQKTGSVEIGYNGKSGSGNIQPKLSNEQQNYPRSGSSSSSGSGKTLTKTAREKYATQQSQEFSGLSPEKRKMIIKALKKKGVLANDFPDEAADLPAEVKQKLRWWKFENSDSYTGDEESYNRSKSSSDSRKTSGSKRSRKTHHRTRKYKRRD